MDVKKYCRIRQYKAAMSLLISVTASFLKMQLFPNNFFLFNCPGNSALNSPDKSPSHRKAAFFIVLHLKNWFDSCFIATEYAVSVLRELPFSAEQYTEHYNNMKKTERRSVIMSIMSFAQQPDIGSTYQRMRQEELVERIAARKKELADDLLILSHHYQHDSIYQFADLTGDSLKLAAEAAKINDRKFLIFCGVHFMAEAADILSAEHQQVLLPHLEAGCPMADMSTKTAVATAWNELATVTGIAEKDITPVTYVNSSAEVKSFVGEKGGSSCTSSNAERVLDWALSRGKPVFFFPDQHLGRNASYALGIPEEQVVLWRRGEPLGGCSRERLKQAGVILWDGYCEVHLRIFPEHVRAWRAENPRATVIVHPECRNEVVRLADMSGSTEAIISAVAAGEPGSHWVIGTESNLVNRLADQHPDKTIHSLTPACLCPTMSAVKAANLLWVLDNLAEGKVVNRIQVPRETAVQAKSCLDRMLSI